MGVVWVREFLGGLDARRLPETTAGGVLVEGTDGHITRGGEFEKRFAFILEHTLPSGTAGLASAREGLYVFGSEEAPALPAGFNYQRLQHPNGDQTLVDVPSNDLFSRNIYAVGVFSDGTTHHFYKGEIVEDWFDGRARTSFRVIDGAYNPAQSASGSFRVTGGTAGSPNEITDITVNGISVFDTAAPIVHTGDNATMATEIADAITAFTSTPNYTAVADGDTVTITAADTGPEPNGYVIDVIFAGDVAVSDIVALDGGSDDSSSTVSQITIDGVDALGSPVTWAGSRESMAELVAATLNAYVSVPEYEAVAVGDEVIIQTAESTADYNGLVVNVSVNNGLVISPSGELTLEGGQNSEDTFPPGQFVKTLGTKMYALSGPNLHFSGVATPTDWNGATGAGFVDMSSYESGSEELIALGRYQNFIAVFAENTIQIWFVDPDPALNRQAQVLGNTGTAYPQSVTQFGDNDLFYLNESGLRSLQARDSSNAASTSDIGTPVDELVIAKLASLNAAERQKVFGLIEPRSGRFWLIIKDEIYVFTFFSGGGGGGVSAWSLYRPGFDVDAAVAHNRRVYLRSGERVYCYGGTETGTAYDETEAVARLPYLDANSPSRVKQFQGIDIAARGTWKVYVAMDPTNYEAKDKVATIEGSSFLEGQITGIGDSTHISLIFKSQGDGPAKLGSAVIHYEGDGDED